MFLPSIQFSFSINVNSNIFNKLYWILNQYFENFIVSLHLIFFQ